MPLTTRNPRTPPWWGKSGRSLFPSETATALERVTLGWRNVESGGVERSHGQGEIQGVAVRLLGGALRKSLAGLCRSFHFPSRKPCIEPKPATNAVLTRAHTQKAPSKASESPSVERRTARRLYGRTALSCRGNNSTQSPATCERRHGMTCALSSA